MQLRSFITALAYPLAAAFVVLATPAQADTLDNIKATGTINVGYRQSSQPVSYVVNDNPTGFVVDLCRDIVATTISDAVKKPVKIKFVPVTAQNRLTMLKEGKIDMECGSTTITEERQKQVGFSVVDFVTTSRLVSLAGTKPSLPSMEGKTLALKAGSSHIELISKMVGGIHVLSVNDAAQGIQAVQDHKAAAYLDDELLIQGAIHKAGLDFKQFTFSDPLSVEPYGIAFRLGDTAFGKLVSAGVRNNFSRTEKAIRSAETYSAELGVPVNTLTRDAIRSPAYSRQCSLIDKGAC
ncbi:transporter substrate-binding domain-containing protein [Silvimonas amylolytica]|uniref:Amino acid ABC transporter substrate-binding protein n=1 Tax=Silvimonas amylolytica TaxID=449663 RepID=A0ABQ2PSE9_9NEIS|nr:transporter substrate-binding domain-containing protein [Silvimonas amylolytica]GGP28178.1 amino acid ABC transporter substrate-binding protein [Silvimonas amylolytica]